MCDRGHAWQGDVRQGMCTGDMHGGDAWQEGVCMVGGMRGRRDGHCSGRYASYWNAFLLQSCVRSDRTRFKI